MHGFQQESPKFRMSDLQDKETECDEICELQFVDTSTHTIVKGKSQIQFTQFEQDDEKLIRIETNEPIIIPFTILQEYMHIAGSNKKHSITIQDIQYISLLLMGIYLITIMGVGMWTFTVMKNVYKMDL